MEAPSDPGSLVRCYGNLYAAARVDALDSLDNLPALKDADELKSKILFSVVVVSRPAVTRLFAASGLCISALGDWLALLHLCLVFLSQRTSFLRTLVTIFCHFLYVYKPMGLGMLDNIACQCENYNIFILLTTKKNQQRCICFRSSTMVYDRICHIPTKVECLSPLAMKSQMVLSYQSLMIDEYGALVER
jgi:hypothetical protein